MSNPAAKYFVTFKIENNKIIVTSELSNCEIEFCKEHINPDFHEYFIKVIRENLTDYIFQGGISHFYKIVNLAIENNCKTADETMAKLDKEATKKMLERAKEDTRKERNTEIASTILSQIGGSSRITAMIGAYNYFTINNGLQFQFKAGTKANKIQIILNAMDTYDVTLYKTRGINCKEVASVSGIYCDQLKGWIERNTGLYLSL